MTKINGGTKIGKEYLIGIGSGSTGYIELYDFDNDIIYQKSNSNVLLNQNNNIRGTSFIFTINNVFILYLAIIIKVLVIII